MNHSNDCDGQWHQCPDCEHGIVMCRTCEGKGGWPCQDADDSDDDLASDVVIEALEAQREDEQ